MAETRVVEGPFVIVDPIEPGAPLPEYCTHGKASCVACGDWCWLGHKTYQAVADQGMKPICLPCANRYIPAGTPKAGRIEDHRRADGPHS